MQDTPEVQAFPNTAWITGLRRFGGIPPSGSYSALELGDVVAKGLPWKFAIRLKQSSQISAEDLSRFLDVSKRTIQRAQREPDKRMLRSTSENAARLAMVIEAAKALFEDETKAMEWLRKPLYGLGMRVPLDVAVTDIGAREVVDLLGRIAWGVIG